ncbi:MAG: BF3164 family lipoprotein [Bacteroidales bacterium]|nr:BF3164 family lipoprotein [Bacteroidales bacterium]
MNTHIFTHSFKTIGIAFGMSLFISCTHKENVTTIEQFPKVEKLIHEEITTPPVLYAPTGLLLLDSAVIIQDLKADTIFQVFKFPSFTHIGGFIKRGGGPDEEMFVDPFMQRLGNNQFMFRNLTGVKMLEYDPSNTSIRTVKNIKFDTSLTDLFHVFPLNNHLIGVRMDKATPKEFVSYDPQTQNVNDFGDSYPVMDENIKIADENKIQLFAKANTVKPDGSTFACVYDKFPILRIYSNTGVLKKEIRLANNQRFPFALIKQEPSLDDVNEMMQDYRMIKATNRFIYALYIGQKNKDISPGLNDFSNIIHVWDWDGNPVMELRLDEKIFTFDVAPDDAFLICSSLEKLDGIYKYVLPL